MITAAAPANIAFLVEGAPAAPFNNSDAAGRCKIERSVVLRAVCACVVCSAGKKMTLSFTAAFRACRSTR